MFSIFMVAFSPYYQFLYFFFNINQTQKRFGTTYNLHLVMIDQSNLKKKAEVNVWENVLRNITQRNV